MKIRIVAWWALGCLLPAAALASRAEIDGRGLPRLLAVDPTLIRTLPGSAARLEPRLDVDVNGGTSTYYIDDSGNILYSAGGSSDTFVLGLGGRTTHFGYLLDGSRHNLVLANPAGWGLVLGYEKNTYHSQSDETQIRADTLYSTSHFENRQDSETLRLGAGWQARTPGGRVYELGLGAGFHHETYRSDRVETGSHAAPPQRRRWESDHGFTVDATLRTLTAGPGPLVAGQVIYVNPKPSSDVGLDLEIWDLTAYLQAGWRVPVSGLDDFVVGISASLARAVDFTPLVVDSAATVQHSSSTTVSPRLFVSGEKGVGHGLLLRGGIQAGGNSTSGTSESTSAYSGGDSYYRAGGSSSWSFGSPTVYLGAGWRWKSIALDGQLSNTLDLNRPVVRWSASVLL